MICSQNGVRLTLIPPLASHMGEAWEHIIRTIRKAFHSLLGSQVVNDVGQLNFVVEVESIIYSRLLFPISFSKTRIEPFTPNHLFLYLMPFQIYFPISFAKKIVFPKDVWHNFNYLWYSWLKTFLIFSIDKVGSKSESFCMPTTLFFWLRTCSINRNECLGEVSKHTLIKTTSLY